jgi:formate-dependent nitrite reductase membrane component NrfD
MTELAKTLVTALADKPWALVAIIGIGGIGYLIAMLFKNTKVTEAIAGRISVDHTSALIEINKGVTGIARNQILIRGDVEAMKIDIARLKDKACTNVACPNRQVEP